MFAYVSYVAAAALAVTLALGGARPPSGAGVEERYVVRPGDTLWALALERYRGDPREAVWGISERNGLEGAHLEPGTVLYLPARAADSDAR